MKKVKQTTLIFSQRAFIFCQKKSLICFHAQPGAVHLHKCLKGVRNGERPQDDFWLSLPHLKPANSNFSIIDFDLSGVTDHEKDEDIFDKGEMSHLIMKTQICAVVMTNVWNL